MVESNGLTPCDVSLFSRQIPTIRCYVPSIPREHTLQQRSHLGLLADAERVELPRPFGRKFSKLLRLPFRHASIISSRVYFISLGYALLNWQVGRESNPHRKFWRQADYHCPTGLKLSYFGPIQGRTKTTCSTYTRCYNT